MNRVQYSCKFLSLLLDLAYPYENISFRTTRRTKERKIVIYREGIGVNEWGGGELFRFEYVRKMESTRSCSYLRNRISIFRRR